MKRRLPVVLLAAWFGAGFWAQASGLPNIIFILADDFGYGDVSCYNPESKVQTPFLDKMAADGMRFTDAHASAQICAPSRYGLLSGRYAFRDKRKDVSRRLTIPKMLKQRGYATAAVGKWHVQHLDLKFQDKDGRKIQPDNQIERLDASKPVKGAREAGFDYFFGTYACPTSSRLYAYIENDRIVGNPNEIFPGFKKWLSIARAARKSADFKFEEVDLVFLDKSKAFIKKHRQENPDHPFFLYHCMQAVHGPAIPADQFVGKSQAGLHGDFIYEADWIVGQLFEFLKEQGIEEDTLVIFSGDNGPETQTGYIQKTYNHNSAYSLRGMKRDNWEGGHREPFIVKWPANVKPGQIDDTLISHVDVLATLAEIADVDIPEGEATDSYSFLPLFQGKPYVRPAPLIHSVTQESADAFAIRTPEWKLLAHQGSGSRNLSRGFEYLQPLSEPDAPGQLYDMRTDQMESNNLWYENPERVEQLLKQLNAMIEE